MMQGRTIVRWASAGAIAIALTLAFMPAAQAQEKTRESFSAFAVAMGTSNPPVLPPGQTTTFQITITRWTTPEERDALLAQLIENGQEALIKALQKTEETGFIRATGRAAARSTFPSERLRYAFQFPGEEGRRRIVLALDRPNLDVGSG